MSKYNFSYSTIADVHAIAEEDAESKKELHDFAQELERLGVAYYGDVEYIYRDSDYGMEIVSMDDYQSEQEEGDE